MTSPASLLAGLSRISARAGVPLHRQVEDSLRRLALVPELQEGGLFPDELTLANRLGVSRGTARAALARLVHEGLLERKAGVGTRVRRQPVESGIGAWRSFSREMARKGVTVETFHSEYRAAPVAANAARALQVEPGSMLQRLDRVRGWDGLPVLQSRSWFHPRLGLKGSEDFGGPLYEVLERETGAIAENAREEFVAVSATAAVAKRLQVKPGEPLLLRCHTVFDAGGRPMEFAEVHYVSSRFTLTLDLRRDGENKLP